MMGEGSSYASANLRVASDRGRTSLSSHRIHESREVVLVKLLGSEMYISQ